MIILALLTQFTIQNLWAKPVEVVIRPYSQIRSGAEVAISDLAEMGNLSRSDQERLKKITLANAPKLGEKRTFSREAIQSALSTEFSGSRLAFRIPSMVMVEHPVPEISRQDVEGQLLAAWKKLCADCEFRLVQLSVPKSALAPGESWQLGDIRERPRGSFSTPIQVSHSSGQRRSLWIHGQVSIYREVAVAKRSLAIGDRLQTEDIESQIRDVTFAADGLPQVEDLLGKQMRIGVRANDILFANAIEKDRALRRGEIVRISSFEDGLEISISGLAEQDGLIGDTVKVRNAKTNQTLAAVVTGKGEVQVK